MTVLPFINRAILVHAPFSFQTAQVEKIACERPRAQITCLSQARALLHEAERVIAEKEERIHYLEKNSATDELTGLINRREFMSVLRREISKTRRSRNNTGLLILIDLDDFKQVNETYSRTIGDNYLQTVASVLINEVRSCDYIARIDGDAFAILMPQINSKAAATRLEKLEKIINARVLHHRDRSIPIRASFGFTMLEEDKTPESLLIEADLNLFSNKAKKR